MVELCPTSHTRNSETSVTLHLKIRRFLRSLNLPHRYMQPQRILLSLFRLRFVLLGSVFSSCRVRTGV